MTAMKRLSAILVALLLLGLQGATFGAADARFPTDWTVVGTSPPGSFGDNPQLAVDDPPAFDRYGEVPIR
jgi:hypothetical protein